MVFTTDRGYDPILSMFVFLKSVGAVTMSGASCSFTNKPDIKFTQKNFLNKIVTEPEFAAAFNEVGKVELEKLLATGNYVEDETQKSYNNIINSFY
jgi:hypothetical protein